MRKSILHLFQIKPNPSKDQRVSLGTQTSTTIREHLDTDFAPEPTWQTYTDFGFYGDSEPHKSNAKYKEN